MLTIPSIKYKINKERKRICFPKSGQRTEGRNHQMIKKAFLWAAVISVMTAIFLFSSQNADTSGKTSTGFTGKIIRVLDVGNRLNAEEIDNIADRLDYIVRKSAHFTIYAALGFFVFLLLAAYRAASAKTLLYSLLWSFAYSCSDEIHQHFVPGRAMLARDVAIDSCGALCGALLAALCCFIAGRILTKRAASD